MRSEKAFRNILKISAVITTLLVILIFITLVLHSVPAIKKTGLSFILNKTWDPVQDEFGALPFIIGTLLTSVIALVICIPFSISISLILGEYFKSGIISGVIKGLVELLAGIPSIVYGFWGLFVLVPVIRNIQSEMDVIPYGVGILTSSLILAVMILPYSASIGCEVIRMVPGDLKEAASSLGANKFEVITNIVIPYSKSGIIAGIFLALGRALGETMAVTMVIGNSNFIPKNIFSPGNTMASVIANEFTEATGAVYLSALVEIGLVLFIITAIINYFGKKVIQHFEIKK
ncbi:MAG: phosphate ABC transporter permease subunit PstC [bacterium]|nr:phosphate ABC transporter permease subunit PstC [bacterium]